MMTENLVSQEGGGLPEKTLKKLDHLAGLSYDNYLKEIDHLSQLDLVHLKIEIGNYDNLPYEVLKTFLPDGTKDQMVAQVLRHKRGVWLKDHPDQSIADSNALEGVITFSGQFVPKKIWEKMSRGERRGVLVGSTCSHFEHGVPGMSDD